MDKNKFSLLSSIKYPEDLRRLSIDQLPQVCKELREDIIDEVAVNPGHFASSLGVVEITVALHYIYNTPYDRIVWDVGHQAYGHKILTGRRENFCKQCTEVGTESSAEHLRGYEYPLLRTFRRS